MTTDWPQVEDPTPTIDASNTLTQSISSSNLNLVTPPPAPESEATGILAGGFQRRDVIHLDIDTTPLVVTTPYASMTAEQLAAAVPAIEPEAPPRRKKVAILGFTESWKLAPFDDPEYEIWCLNELYVYNVPRWDRWFEIHKREVYEADKKRVPDHIVKLQAMTCPIYMQQHWDDIPCSIEYPLNTVIQHFGDYLTNTISFMIALAILEGFEHIGIYGVDMAHDTEYGSQRPSCEYFVGIARGRGISVYIPDQADLMKALFIYGYQEEEQGVFFAKLKARREELESKLNGLLQQLAGIDNQRGQLLEAIAQYRGAIQDVDHVRKIWAPSNSVTMGGGSSQGVGGA